MNELQTVGQSMFVYLQHQLINYRYFNDLHIFLRTVAAICFYLLNFIYHVHSFNKTSPKTVYSLSRWGSAYRCICLHLFRSKSGTVAVWQLQLLPERRVFLQVIQTFLVVCVFYASYIYLSCASGPTH